SAANISGVGGSEVASSFSLPDFSSDPRMHFVQETEKWTYTGDDGVTYEYDEIQKAWFPMYNEKLIEAQQSAYSVPGVNEAEPILPKPRTKRKNVYTMDDDVHVTVEELAEVFSKCGVLMEDYVKGGPRIKIYKDSKDVSKGDALVTYLKEESVTLACQLLDDTEFRPNEQTKISVQMAEFKEKEIKPGEASQQQNSNVVQNNKVDKRKIQKKIQQLGKKLEWFDEETGKRSERSSKMVVLKHMFTLEELEEDPGLLLELKEDIRTECETLGEVTNVVLYD
ncbi:5438_t:CDS:2, partial [Ambispora leptoticha]